jgi:anthranilate synthase component 2
MVSRLTVMRNDEINYDLIEKANHIILSPGPGLPQDTNDLFSVISKYNLTHNILGVCLGHQSIAEYFGAKLINLKSVNHGISSKIKIHDKQFLYKDLPDSFLIGHYHSWVIKNLPDQFIVTGTDNSDNIMSFRHKSLKIFGLQYHPESILTENGSHILRNWIINT